MFAFNPVTGAMLKGTPSGGLDLGYTVIQAQLMSDTPDENFLKGILLVDSNIKVCTLRPECVAFTVSFC